MIKVLSQHRKMVAFGLISLSTFVLWATARHSLGGADYVTLDMLEDRCERALRAEARFFSDDLFFYEAEFSGSPNFSANRTSSVRYRLELPGRVLQGRCLSEPPGVVLEKS